VFDEDELKIRDRDRNPFKKPQDKYQILKMLEDNKEDAFKEIISELRTLNKKQEYFTLVKDRSTKVEGLTD
jgi:hypothetical protein